MIKQFKFAAIQIAASADKAANLKRAATLIRDAAKDGAQVVALPEIWNSPYGNNYFRTYAERVPDGESSTLLRSLAQELDLVIIGGSIPEIDDDGKLFNTNVTYDGAGNLLCKFRKVHLFDVDIPGGITFFESKTLSAGNSVATFDTRFGHFGVAICYDIRFSLLSQLMVRRGAKFLVYPGAFNMTTGPLHWDLLLRARAVDTQSFVAVVSPARDETASYHAWGHSSVSSPWGKVIATTEEKEAIVYADIDLGVVDQMRQAIPVSHQQRTDLYELIDKTVK